MAHSVSMARESAKESMLLWLSQICIVAALTMAFFVAPVVVEETGQSVLCLTAYSMQPGPPTNPKYLKDWKHMTFTEAFIDCETKHFRSFEKDYNKNCTNGWPVDPFNIYFCAVSSVAYEPVLRLIGWVEYDVLRIVVLYWSLRKLYAKFKKFRAKRRERQTSDREWALAFFQSNAIPLIALLALVVIITLEFSAVEGLGGLALHFLRH